MPTHPHLLVETPYAGLGRWMQQRLADYARYYNRRYGRSGHLFQARYKAILVEDGEYLLECSRYIHMNPNRKKLTRPAELWPWSSYRNFVGGPAAADWVSTERILAHFASPEDYRAYVESGRDEKPISPFERATAGLVLGSPAFVERIRALEKGLRPVRDLTGRRALRQSGDLASYELLSAAVEKHFAKMSGCQRRQILAFVLYRLTWLKTTQIADLVRSTFAGLSENRRNQLLGFVLWKYTWLKGVEIAEIVRRTPGAVSQMVRRIELRVSTHSQLASALETIGLRLEEKRQVNRPISVHPDDWLRRESVQPDQASGWNPAIAGPHRHDSLVLRLLKN